MPTALAEHAKEPKIRHKDNYVQPQEGNAATLPHIKAKQAPAVPSSFVIPPNEQERQYAAMRQKLAGKQSLPGLTI